MKRAHPHQIMFEGTDQEKGVICGVDQM